MVVEIKCNCGRYLDAGDEIYCEEEIQEKDNEIEKLQKTIDEQEAKNEKLLFEIDQKNTEIQDLWRKLIMKNQDNP